MNKFSHLLHSADESDVYLTAGVAALFVGICFIFLPAGLIVVGLIFIALAYLEAQREGKNGPA